MIFSVIVPFLNEEKYIGKCIKALLNQNFPQKEYQLIFINNGSTDKSEEIVKKYKRIILLNEKLVNPYAARNKGLLIAAGKIISFTDADCEPDSYWLKNIYEYFKLNKHTKLILGKTVYRADSPAALKIIEDYESEKLRYVTRYKMRNYVYGFTNNLSIKNDVMNGFGHFTVDKDYNHDARLANYVANHFSNGAVKYLLSAKVVHLGVDNTLEWYKKMNFYGRDCVELSKSSGYVFLGSNHNLEIFFRMVKRNNYNILRAFYALVVLICGLFFFRTGKVFLKNG